MKSRFFFALLLASAAVPFGCSDDAEDPGAGSADGGAVGASSSSGGASSSSGASGTPSDAGSCDRTPRPDDALRFVVASRPYAADATASNRFSIFSLDSTGTITPLSDFELGGQQHNGNIAFTIDGAIGAAVLESDDNAARGGVAVFRLSAEGVPMVVHPFFKQDFFAESVAFSPDGKWLYAVESSTVANGGGLYAMPVACDGTLGSATRITQSSTTSVPAWLHGDPTRAFVAGNTFAGAPSTDDGLHLLAFAPTGVTRLGSGNVFGQPTNIRMGAVSADDGYVVLSAWNELVGGPRVIAARLDGQTPVLETQWGPEQGLRGGAEVVLDSPFGNSFFVTSSDGNGSYFIPYYGAAGNPDAGDAGSRAFGPLRRIAELTGAPELSSSGMVIRRGALKGRIVLSEAVAIRQFQFQADGTVTDVSETILSNQGDDVSEIMGALGVTP